MKEIERLENGKLVFHSYDALKEYCDNPEHPLDVVVLGKEIDSLPRLFFGAYRTNEQFKGIADWDVSNIKNMEGMFLWAYDFNQPLNKWDVSNVTDMHEMFNEALSFNQPLNNWDVSNVTCMYNMFRDAKSFNQPLDNFSSEQKNQACYHFDEVKYKNDQANKNNSSSNSSEGYIDKVIKLAELREKGFLSEAEFEKMKEDLLKQSCNSRFEVRESELIEVYTEWRSLSSLSKLIHPV